MADIKRIEIGNSKFPSIDEVKVVPGGIAFEFSSNTVTFDTDEKTFDEDINKPK